MDQFAEMMMREFIFTRKTLGDKVDRLEVRMERLEKRTDTVEKTMATKDDIARLEKRIDCIEDTMATKDDIARIEKKFDPIYALLSGHSVRIQRLERLKLA